MAFAALEAVCFQTREVSSVSFFTQFILLFFSTSCSEMTAFVSLITEDSSHVDVLYLENDSGSFQPRKTLNVAL